MNDQEFNFENMVNGALRANKKVLDNYLDNFSSYNHDLRDIFLTYSFYFTKLYVSPLELSKVQNHYVEFLGWQQRIWANLMNRREDSDYVPAIKPGKHDKRFSASQWTDYPFFDLIKQNYLLWQRQIHKMIEEIDMDGQKKKKLQFYTSQYSNFFSPSNFLYTNPEALDLAIKTNGESLWKGFNNFLGDLEKGKISQTNESAFEIGKNLAITPGAVVFENELIQLIQYQPGTAKAHAIPLLIIPPWINKYYVLDLRPENSFVKFIVDHGVQVFIISWKNPGPGMGHISFSDYIQKGAMDALRVTSDISSSGKVNTLGYCVGGTLLGITGSVLAAQDNDIINTNTFIASMIDFGNIGPMGAVIDKALIRKLKRGEILRHGVLRGEDMERAFNLMRSNDLVWNYAVNNYLKGEEPRPFDVLYWTNDNTNLPANMYIYYLKHMIMGNKLSRKNFLRICDTSIDIGRIKAPSFVIAFKEDYISPASTVFRTTELVSGPVEFIYGESGHVMGVINPPSKKKYGHYVQGVLGKGFSEWKKTAEFRHESWWMTWIDKLIDHSGEKITVSKNLGNKRYPVIEPAPGSYVFEGTEKHGKGSFARTRVKPPLKVRHDIPSEQNN